MVKKLEFIAKTVTLKSGSQVLIRMVEETDAPQLLALKRDYIENTQTLPLTLEEYPDSKEKELVVIQRFREAKNSLLIVAEYDNQLIGNIDFTEGGRQKLAHTAMLGMGIQETWRNQGLGSVLIEAGLDWMRKNPTIELIWLDVYASNKRGYHLYQKCGFEVSGTIKGFFKDNGLQDKTQMFQYVK